MKTKRGISMPQEMTGWYLVAIIVLVVIVLSMLVLKGKITNIGEYVRSVLRFGKI